MSDAYDVLKEVLDILALQEAEHTTVGVMAFAIDRLDLCTKMQDAADTEVKRVLIATECSAMLQHGRGVAEAWVAEFPNPPVTTGLRVVTHFLALQVAAEMIDRGEKLADEPFPMLLAKHLDSFLDAFADTLSRALEEFNGNKALRVKMAADLERALLQMGKLGLIQHLHHISMAHPAPTQLM
jgi:hypothetical protein